jgi:serpin B
MTPKPAARRRRRTTFLAAAFATSIAAITTGIAAITTGCAAAGPGPGPGVAPRVNVLVTRGAASRVPAVSPKVLGPADTAFGLDLLGAWCAAQPRSDIVFSPESLASGLGLAYLGARGSTATAMARVLNLPAGSALQTEAAMRARWAALGALDRPGVTLTGSNRVWADPALPPLRSYLDAVATGYSAGLSRVPLIKDPAAAEQTINAAIDSDTRGHIPELLPPGALSGDIFVLTDALYMDAKWLTPFQASQTQPGPFTTAAGTTASAQYMSGSGYRYAQSGGWTGVELPYRGGALAMTALLPPAGAAGCQVPAVPTLSTIAARVTGPLRAAPGGGFPPGLASVELPAVNLASHQKMNGLLTGLGMGVAFSGLADFAGLSPAAANISIVEHAATLQVGEQGTVGSAATAVGIAASAAPAVIGPRIDFDRPYLMLVTDTATGEPLFLARVADPTA